jgi:hypothetical protein
MKRMRQFASLIAAAAMVVTSVPMNGWTVQAQAATTPTVDTTVKHSMIRIRMDLANFRDGAHPCAGGQIESVTVTN